MKNTKFVWNPSKKVNRKNFRQYKKVGFKRFVLKMSSLLSGLWIIAMALAFFLTGELDSNLFIPLILTGLFFGITMSLIMWFSAWFYAR